MYVHERTKQKQKPKTKRWARDSNIKVNIMVTQEKGKSPMEELLGSKLLTKVGKSESTDIVLKGKKLVLFYFSASWYVSITLHFIFILVLKKYSLILCMVTLNPSRVQNF